MKVSLHTLLRGMTHEKTFALKEGQSSEELEHTQALLVRHYTDEDETFRAAASGRHDAPIARTQSGSSVLSRTQSSGRQGCIGGSSSASDSVPARAHGGNNVAGDQHHVGSGGGVVGHAQGDSGKVEDDNGSGSGVKRHGMQEGASGPAIPSKQNAITASAPGAGARQLLRRTSTFAVDARVHAPVLHREASSMKLEFARPTATAQKSSHELREEKWHQDYRRTKAMSSVVDNLTQHSAIKRAAAEMRAGSCIIEQAAEAGGEDEESGSGAESDGEGDDGKTSVGEVTGTVAIGGTNKKKAHAHRISAFHQFSAREQAAALLMTKLAKGFLARRARKKTVEHIEAARAKGLRYTDKQVAKILKLQNMMRDSISRRRAAVNW